MNQDTQTPELLSPDLKLIYAVQNAEQRARNEQMYKSLKVVEYHRDMAKRNGAREVAMILDIIHDQIGPEKIFPSLTVTPS